MPTKILSVVAAFALFLGADVVSANEGGHAGWARKADNEIGNLPSLQRGARNFLAYCSGCHSLRFMRYSRLAQDLKIPDDQRDQYRRVIKQRGADAMASVETSACTGCFVSVTAQMLNELINAESLVFCKSCGRLLYLHEDERPAGRR